MRYALGGVLSFIPHWLHHSSNKLRGGYILGALFILHLGGCASYPMNRAVNNSPGAISSTYTLDQPPPVSGVGVEARDVESMTERMVRSMLQNPRLANRAQPPRVIIDDAYFINNTSQRFNTRIITKRLLTKLNDAAQGRMVFVARNQIGMVENERKLKRNMKLSSGNRGFDVRMMGADYRLAGSIDSINAMNTSAGLTQRDTYIDFQMIDLESSELVWSGDYEMHRVGANNVIYY